MESCIISSSSFQFTRGLPPEFLIKGETFSYVHFHHLFVLKVAIEYLYFYFPKLIKIAPPDDPTKARSIDPCSGGAYRAWAMDKCTEMPRSLPPIYSQIPPA
jgi:hypothetical protein